MNSDQKFIPVFGKICWKRDIYNESSEIKRDGFYSWGWIVEDKVWLLEMTRYNTDIYDCIEYNNKWNQKTLSFKRIKKYGAIRGKVHYMVVGNNIIGDIKPTNLPILPELSIEELNSIELKYKQGLDEEMFFYAY